MTIANARTGVAGPAAGTRIVATDSNHLVFTFDRMFVMNWRVDTTRMAVSRVSQAITNFATSFTPARIILLTVIEVSASMPPADARDMLAKLMKVNTPYLIRSAVGYEGSGFRGAAFRAVSTGIAVLSNHEFPHRIFAGIPLATEWLAAGLSEELGQTVKGTTLADLVHRVRHPPKR